MLFILSVISSLLSFAVVDGQGLSFNNNIIFNSCDANIDAITFSGGTCGTFDLFTNFYSVRTCRSESTQVFPSGQIVGLPTFTFLSNEIIILTECSPIGYSIYYAPGDNCPSSLTTNGTALSDPRKAKKIIRVEYTQKD